ncbi:hypothetical protein RHMOL_Rhmol05G0037400 [Rhododendron molle]|uniref:Uncharacterized protein n=1 Tax=Rhododendron molle TaxID=49168 RepID=A0ACC0NMB1_RHOML|nr:hypothetical protein RHMOL_Rhmol05G0037400 [Rhododendron molle]
MKETVRKYIKVVKEGYKRVTQTLGIEFSFSWVTLMRAIVVLSFEGIIQEGLNIVVKSGNATKFWDQVWLENIPLKSLFPRLHMASLQKNTFIKDIKSDSSYLQEEALPLGEGST